MNFLPVIWPQDTVPDDVTHYEQCEVCSPKSPIIWGEGNPKAPIVVVLDNPGARIDKDGQEFVCGTRQTLQMALNKVDLTMDDVYITYLIKCRPLKKYDKEKARLFSRPFLVQQINNIHPKILVCLGDTVVKSILEDNEASVKTLRGSWHSKWGYPLAVSYHPLAVRRRPNLMGVFMEDWQMVAQFLKGGDI